jgi:hypothetical protein
MVITIEDDPHALVELLWIREAWELQVAGDDLPPLLSDSSVGAHTEANPSGRIALWQDAWPAIWEACLDHAGQVRDGGLFERLHETADGSAERAELLHRLIGPTWRDTFGDEAFTHGYRGWNQANAQARSRSRPRFPSENPERVSLDALIPAWQAGLSKIVVIPCRGTYTRVIGQHALLVTAETRDHSQRYGEALTQFR